MDWFEEWFDSPLYERLYADRDEDEAEQLICFLEAELNLEKGTTVLDLGCGRGRHSFYLNKRGYDVTGIDLSGQAIETAREKAEIREIDDIRFEVRDMRNPLDKTFDVILNLFTTFGYFESDEENGSVLDSVVQMLSPGGILVIDYLNASKVKSSYHPCESGSFQNINYEIKRYIEDDVIYKDIEFYGDQIENTRTYSERVKLYELDWFKKQMKSRGFEIENVYGDYEGNEFDPERSSRLLIISRLNER